MDFGDAITFWTAWLAMVLYVLALALRWSRPGQAPWLAAARWAWTIGWAANIAHVLWGLGFVHGWSQQSAFEETARRTEEAVGAAVGAGLYVNYLFLLVWGLDTVWWWRVGIERYERRSPWLAGLIQSFLAFIVFNATVVFATGFIRWFGIAACVVLPLLWWRGRPKCNPQAPG